MDDARLQARSRLLARLVAIVLALLLFAAAVELVEVIRGRFGIDYLALVERRRQNDINTTGRIDYSQMHVTSDPTQCEGQLQIPTTDDEREVC